MKIDVIIYLFVCDIHNSTSMTCEYEPPTEKMVEIPNEYQRIFQYKKTLQFSSSVHMMRFSVKNLKKSELIQLISTISKSLFYCLQMKVISVTHAKFTQRRGVLEREEIVLFSTEKITR